MQISIEISMYPLQDNYEEAVLAFLEHLSQYEGIAVRTNSMSTHIFGNFDQVMYAVQESMRSTFESEGKSAMVMKVINANLDYEYQR